MLAARTASVFEKSGDYPTVQWFIMSPFGVIGGSSMGHTQAPPSFSWRARSNARAISGDNLWFSALRQRNYYTCFLFRRLFMLLIASVVRFMVDSHPTITYTARYFITNRPRSGTLWFLLSIFHLCLPDNRFS